MKTKLYLLVAGMFLAATSSALATVRYVNVNNADPTPPYTNWASAATNIQDAVDAAGVGDEIVVTNGTYTPVKVNTPLTLQSVNGPGVTIIDGGGTASCVYLATNALVVGFTLTNGVASSGGGVYCESSSAVLTNCVLTGNYAQGYWVGFLLGRTWVPGIGGGAYGGTLNNCTLTGNSAYDGGGGAGAYGSTLNNCTLTGNSAGAGGGACGDPNVPCTLNNCTLTGNSATIGGGASDCTLNNCTVTGNSASNWGGGACACTLNNCTVTGNSATYGGGARSCTLNNCIVYFNSDPNGGNYDASSTLNYCCTTPVPTNGVGNISADPQLASASHLSALSPCIGAGSATYANGTDIDGEAWANPPSIGCDEYHAGAVTGPLMVSLTATFTNVVPGFPVGLTAFIAGRTDLSVWDFGDGFVAVTEPYTSHAWTAPGDYLVSLWAFNDSYPEGVSATVTVHVVEKLYYVALTSSNPVVPYTSWATAATNIQDAVDVVSVAGATILVTNGTYGAGGRTTPSPRDGATNRVVVDKPLTVRSVNGPGVTVIQGQMPNATNGFTRCVYLTDGATLVGFTLTNGLAGLGGGVYCESTSAVLSNCVLSGNSATEYYGGVEEGGGACGGTLNNCTLTGNSAFDDGGGASDCTLNNCTLTGNSANSGFGGGASGCTVNNCALTGNSAEYSGGAYGGTLNNCALTGNLAEYGGGTGAYTTLNNCTLTGNSAFDDGGGACGATLNNCTLTGNSASDGGGAAWGTLNNCIVYYNSAAQGANYCPSPYGGGVLTYCCTTPMPTNGVGNITNTPLFVDYAGGNLRLQSNSPCINSGNNAYVIGSTDLDGNPRIVFGTVDIGAYEYQTPASIISYAWLQQYGLPTDGSVDHADLDGTGMNVYQDWVAGLNPTNALSVLKMLPPAATNNPLGLVVSWQSVSNITYFLQRSTKLAAQPAFSTIQSNIIGQAGTTSYTDTTATNAGPYFYRVSVGN
ncbi:MAG TPA: choice-of-anchor Q domain-containing protein [Candidatus Limnocylindrales bacterium]|nr:choice-of-anchor Q domain-containing protein [Candidatus Limnocylindrales bacterium]